MSFHVEIKIEIYSEAVKTFVTEWIAENVPQMDAHAYMKSMNL